MLPKNYTLRAKFTLTIALAVLLTVVLVSVLSNIFINRQFVKYIAEQQQEKTAELASSLSQQYYSLSDSWDINFIHTIGMNSLYDGYIINVFNNNEESIWDAQAHDMSMCAQVMSDIKERMEKKYPSIDGEFTSELHPLIQNGRQVGSVEISYFGPFFLSEADFNYLDTLNIVLLGIGLFAQVVAVLIGGYMAGRLSRPILKTANASRQMAHGDYAARIDESTNTHELNQLIHSINHLASTLDKQETLRKQLTADVAHELRTPLHTMGMQIESMMMGVWEPTPERLQSCYDEIERISTLVKDLENLARVESEDLKLDIHELDYWELVNKSLESLEMEVSKKDILIVKEGGPTTIYADPTRWRQVVHNLLTNAIKYTPDGGTITVTIKQDKKRTVLSVQDTGIGIPQDEIPFIFERFYRTEKSRNRTTGGTGIGLAVVKSVVQSHNGSIEVESKVNVGSVFRVILPSQ